MNEPDSSSNQLQRSLAKLHADLAGTSKADEGSKRLLREVLNDIERLLRDEKPVAPASTSRLESLAVRLDSDHPALSASLREFVDLLGRAGI